MRRHIPATLALIPSQRSVDVLVSAAEPPVAKGGATHLAPARSVLVLQRLD